MSYSYRPDDVLLGWDKETNIKKIINTSCLKKASYLKLWYLFTERDDDFGVLLNPESLQWVKKWSGHPFLSRAISYTTNPLSPLLCYQDHLYSSSDQETYQGRPPFHVPGTYCCLHSLCYSHLQRSSFQKTAIHLPVICLLPLIPENIVNPNMGWVNPFSPYFWSGLFRPWIWIIRALDKRN